MKIFFRTYGCTLNQADTEIMKALVRDAGHVEANAEDTADVVVVNTCTVKGPTENKIMYYLKGLKKSDRKFVVAGCMSINKEVAGLGVPVLSAGAFRHIADAINDAKNKRQTFYMKRERREGLAKVFTPPIARIPIQDGCVNACSFCQTKLSRPGLSSESTETIESWMKTALKLKCKEFQFTGMDTGAYGIGAKTDVAGLLSKITKKVKGDYKIRLGMINPQHAKRLLGGLVNAYKDEHMYKFLHVPVQGGSLNILNKMNRKHTVKDFVDVVKAFRKKFPDITIATDIIVGHPGETEKDFRETIRLLDSVKPEIVNLSKFCPRPGTKAAEMKQLPTQKIKERSVLAHKAIKRNSEVRNRKYIGQKLDILVTEYKKGRTEFYRQAVLDRETKLGSWVRAEVVGATPTSLITEVIH